MQDNKVEIKFDLSEVSNKFLLHLKETTDIVTFIYNSINYSDDIPLKPLPTDSFPIAIDNKKPPSTKEELKFKTINWVLNKAFEEFINGMTKSFKAAYMYLQIYSQSLTPKKINNRDAFECFIKKTEAEIEELSFPLFLDKIESLINQPLLYKEEILSINKIRNCLIHRHGIVRDKDLKGTSVNSLCLKWISMKNSTIVNGKQIDITYDYRKDTVLVNNLTLEIVSKQKEFRLGEEIILDINEFNDISYTCYMFVTKLYSLMPLPPEKKTNGA